MNQSTLEDVGLSLELGDGPTLWAVLECPKCRETTRVKAESLPVGSKLACPCGGVSLTIDNETFTEVQRSLSDLKKTMDNFGQ